MSNFTTNPFNYQGQSNKMTKPGAMVFKMYPIKSNPNCNKPTSLTQQKKFRPPMVLRQKYPSQPNLHSRNSLLYKPLSRTLTSFDSNTHLEQKSSFPSQTTDLKKFLKSCTELSVPNSIKDEFLNSFKHFEKNVISSSNIKMFNLDDKKSNRPETFLNTRKRTLSYIWIKDHLDSKQGYVFYGGSVYRPESNDPTFSDQEVKEIIETLTGKYSEFDLEAINKLLKRKNNQSRFNREQELHTALERLRKCPVIFKTCAQTHEEVRDEIRKNVFRQGVSA